MRRRAFSVCAGRKGVEEQQRGRDEKKGGRSVRSGGKEEDARREVTRAQSGKEAGGKERNPSPEGREQ